MVMGRITRSTIETHQVTFVLFKQKYDITCNCGFRDRVESRNIAFSKSHEHIASMYRDS
jgi:hypothetical protein